ncbi:hypothetical protein FO519_006411 [Halicephalobus sp. NKZ332]|nr:hypothetical protein FO519_006411 [Halicephalobus sp. NKZ332]
MDLTCDESMPTDRDLDPTLRFRRPGLANNIPVPQPQPAFNQLPLNLNIQNQPLFGSLNLVQQLNQPSTSQLLAQYHMRIKLAEAMQRTQNANFLLPNQNSGLFPGLGNTAPQNPLLMTQNAFRTPVIVNGSANFTQPLLSQQNLDFSALSQGLDPLALCQQLALQASLPNFQASPSSSVQQPQLPTPSSISNLSLSILQNPQLQQQVLQSQQLLQSSALLTPTQTVQSPVVRSSLQSNLQYLQKVEKEDGPELSLSTPSISSIQPLKAEFASPLTGSITESADEAGTEPEMVRETTPEPEPPKKVRSPKRQDNYCVPLNFKSFLPGADPSFSNNFQLWPEEDPVQDSRKRVLFFHNPRNLQRFCDRPGIAIDWLRKGYRLKTLSPTPFKEELKYSVQDLIEEYEEVTATEYETEDKQFCLEVLLQIHRDQDLRKIEQDRLMKETIEKLDRGVSAAITQEYIDKDNLLPGTSGGTLESDGLVLAAVADAASSPMKRQLAQQRSDQEASTSQSQESGPQLLSNILIQDKSQTSGVEEEVCEFDPDAEPEPCSSADSLAFEKTGVTEEEVKLLKEFASSSLVDDSKEKKRRKSLREGALKFADLVRVRNANEDEKEDFENFLPEAIRISDLDQDQREDLVFEIPEKVDFSKISWTFNPKGRRIGVLPVDDMTVVKTVPLPFSVEKKMTKFDKFVWMHDRYMQFVSCELFGDTLEYNRVVRESSWLNRKRKSENFEPLPYKEKTTTRLAPSANKILRLVQERLLKQTYVNYNAFQWAKENLIETKKELLGRESNDILEVSAIQTYYALVSFYHSFPDMFDFLKPVLNKYRFRKSGLEFVEEMKKWNQTKDKIISIAKAYDEKTKGRTEAGQCLKKALEKMLEMESSSGITVDRQGESENVDMEVEEPLPSVSGTFEDEHVGESAGEIRQRAFQSREEFYQESLKNYKVYSAMDFLGKSRRISHRIADLRFHVDHEGTLVALQDGNRVFHFPGRRKCFDQRKKNYAYPDPTKVVSGDDAYFKRGNNLPPIENIEIGSKTWKSSVKWEKLESSVHGSFEKQMKGISMMHEIFMENNKNHFPMVYEGIQEVVRNFVSGDIEICQENERRFIELLLLFKGNSWIIPEEEEEEDNEDNENESTSDVVVEKKRMRDVHEKVEEWLEIMTDGKDEEKLQVFPQLFEMSRWKDHFRTRAMVEMLESQNGQQDPTVICKAPEITSGSGEKFVDDDYPELDDPLESETPPAACKLMDRKSIEKRSLEQVATAHEKAIHVVNYVETEKASQARVAELIASYTDATDLMQKPLPKEVEHVYDDPYMTLSTEAVMINRGLIPPRAANQTSSDVPGPSNSKNVQTSSLASLKEKGMRLTDEMQDNYEFKDVFDDRMKEHFSWMHINGDFCEDTGIYDVCLHNDPRPVVDGNEELLEHAGEYVERELNDILYRQYIEANRSVYLINQVQRVHQRILSHFARRSCRDRIVTDTVEFERPRVTNIKELEDDLDQETAVKENSLLYQIWREREKRTVKAFGIEKKIRTQLKTVSSNREMKAPKKKKNRVRRSVFAAIREIARQNMRKKRNILNQPVLLPGDYAITKSVRRLMKIRKQELKKGRKVVIRKLRRRNAPPMVSSEESSDSDFDYTVDEDGVDNTESGSIVFERETKTPDSPSNSNRPSRQISPLISNFANGSEIFAKHLERAKNRAEAEQGSPHPMDTLRAVLDTTLDKNYINCSNTSLRQRVKLAKDMQKGRSYSKGTDKAKEDSELPMGISAAMMMPLETILERTAKSFGIINYDENIKQKEIQDITKKTMEKVSKKKASDSPIPEIPSSMVSFELNRIAPIKDGKQAEPSSAFKEQLERSAKKREKLLKQKFSRGTQTGKNVVTVDAVFGPTALPERRDDLIQKKAESSAEERMKKIRERKGQLKIASDDAKRNAQFEKIQYCGRQRYLQNIRFLNQIAYDEFSAKTSLEKEDILTPAIPIPLASISPMVFRRSDEEKSKNEEWLTPPSYGEVLSVASSPEPEGIIPWVKKIISSSPYKINSLERSTELESVPLSEMIEQRPRIPEIKHRGRGVGLKTKKQSQKDQMENQLPEDIDERKSRSESPKGRTKRQSGSSQINGVGSHKEEDIPVQSKNTRLRSRQLSIQEEANLQHTTSKRGRRKMNVSEVVADQEKTKTETDVSLEKRSESTELRARGRPKKLQKETVETESESPLIVGPGRRRRMTNSQVESKPAELNDIKIASPPLRGRRRKSSTSHVEVPAREEKEDSVSPELGCGNVKQEQVPRASGAKAVEGEKSKTRGREMAPSPEAKESSEEEDSEPPSPVMMESKKEDLRNVSNRFRISGVESEAESDEDSEKESDEDESDDDEHNQMNSSQEEKRRRQGRQRYEHKANWGHKRRNKLHVEESTGASSSVGSKKPKLQRKKRTKHKWADTPSRTPSPRPPSPPLPAKRNRKQAKPIEIVYSSPRKKKNADKSSSEVPDLSKETSIASKTEEGTDEFPNGSILSPESSDERTALLFAFMGYVNLSDRQQLSVRVMTYSAFAFYGSFGVMICALVPVSLSRVMAASKPKTYDKLFSGKRALVICALSDMTPMALLAVICVARHDIGKWLFFGYAVLTFLAYVVTFVSNFVVFRIVAKHIPVVQCLHDKTRLLETRQVAIATFSQAMVPLVCQVPAFLTLSSALLLVEPVTNGNVIVITQLWLAASPLFDGLITLFVIKQYRHQTLKWCSGICGERWRSTKSCVGTSNTRTAYYSSTYGDNYEDKV